MNRIWIAAGASVLVLATAVGVYAATSRTVSGENPIRKAAPASGASAAYAALAKASPAPQALRANLLVRDAASAGGVDAAGLSVAAVVGDKSLLVGRTPSDATCVALAGADSAGSFTCNPLAKSPVFLVAVSSGGPSGATEAGVIGIASTAVARLVIETASGATREINVEPTRAFSYDAKTLSDFGQTINAYDASGALLLSQPLPGS